LAVSIDKTDGQLRETVSALLAPTASYLDLDLSFSPDDVLVNDHYLGAGYAVLTGAERNAIRHVAQLEGILLDPVYSGKAMAGLLDMIHRGEIGSRERVLFWHTGGLPALFAYTSELAK
jgi:D-cysteine desulfhydrase